MHIIEIEDKPQNWIAAVYSNEKEGAEYLKKITAKAEHKIVSHTFPSDKFPVYIIEKYATDDSGKEYNYFEFTDEEGYIDLIRTQKQNQDADSFKVYFTAYCFEEDYFQESYGSSMMGAINHAHVDNYHLQREDSEKGLSFGYINRLANSWDFDSLDQFFLEYMKDGTTEEKEELANGYLSLFCTMTYDFACGKLTQEGIAKLLPIAEKTSLLMGEKLWDVYSSTYITLMEDAIRNHPDKIDIYFKEAENAIYQNIKESPEEKQDGYKQLSFINELMAENRGFDQAHWEKAIKMIVRSIQIDPVQGDWFSYLKLVFLPYKIINKSKVEGVDSKTEKDLLKTWASNSKNEVKEFQKSALSLQNTYPAVSLNLALAFKRFNEYVEWLNSDIEFPEKDYLFWIDLAKQIEIQPATQLDLTEAGHFFYGEGKRLKRIDLLETAIKYFERLIEHIENPAFETYYKASCLEAIADIHYSNGNFLLAADYMDKTSAFYEENLALVKKNGSVLMHYAEYLERCYHYQANNPKPTIEKLEEFTQLAEEDGDGMYLSPIMLRIRLALLGQNEEEIIFQITKSLLLFELSMQDELEALKQKGVFSPYQRLNSFLNETFLFMSEVKENYYIDSQIKWLEVNKMNPDEVAKKWEERKEEIRKREKIDWN